MTAQINSIKTKNQIYADFRTLVNNALTTFNITGWDVKRFYQTEKTMDLKPCVLLYIFNKKQASTQSNQNIIVNDKLYKRHQTKKEVSIRFYATMRNTTAETTATNDSIDILDRIKEYLQTDSGRKALTTIGGYAQYRASDIKQQNFENDEDNVQMLPFFECTFLYTDSWQETVNYISKVKFNGIYKI